MTEYVTPNIHTVLKKYQTSAPKSLQGPGHSLANINSTNPLTSNSSASNSSVPVAAAAANANVISASSNLCSAAAVHCPLDVTLNNGGVANLSTTDIHGLVAMRTSPCDLIKATPSGGPAVGGLTKHSNQTALSTGSATAPSSNPSAANPALPLIKKEIMTSPEPAPQPHDLQNEGPLAHVPQPTSCGPPLPQPPPPSIKIMPPPPPEVSQPILSAADTGSGELYETRLEGKTIGCFSMGGEMRLCLPQFLNNVLAEFTLEQINRSFDDLGIFCSQCTPEQLMEFKAAKILPNDVKSSGLITRTDAERLCAVLLHRSDRNSYINVEDIPKGAISFKVYHRCFGKCEGICTPDMYSYQKPTCIMCLECKGWFSPQKFVGHVHRKVENRTCHWGFDSRNWHDYLHVALDVENRDKYQKILDELKEVEIKEQQKAQQEINYLKRKAEMHLDHSILVPSMGLAPPPHQPLPPSVGKHRGDQLDIPSTKKTKGLDEASAYQLEYQHYQSLMYAHCAQQQRMAAAGQMSAFRPWPQPKTFMHAAYNAAAVAALSTLPYLSQEPPVLQNPERVVRSSDRERFERTYQPNVALAPRKTHLTQEREKEQRELRERERMEREREREMERMRERERERSREREREYERERDLKERERELQKKHQLQQQQQHQQQIKQQPPTVSGLCEGEIQIKQERAPTPNEMNSPTPPPHNSHLQEEERRSNSSTCNQPRPPSSQDDEATPTTPLMSPLSLGRPKVANHHHHPHLPHLDLQTRRLSLQNSCNSSNSSNSASSTTPTNLATSPPAPKSHTHTPPVTQLQQLQQQQRGLVPPAAASSSSSSSNTSHSYNMRQSPSPNRRCNSATCTNPRSPEEFGGSNEITSSTSPLPQQPQQLQQQQQQQLQQQQHNAQTIIATVNHHNKLLPAGSTFGANLSSSGNSAGHHNEIPGRIRISKNLLNQNNIIRSPTPPMHHQLQVPMQQQQQAGPMSSSTTAAQQQYEYYKQNPRFYPQQQVQQQQQQLQQHRPHHHSPQPQQNHHHNHQSPSQSSNVNTASGLNLTTNVTSTPVGAAAAGTPTIAAGAAGTTNIPNPDNGLKPPSHLRITPQAAATTAFMNQQNTHLHHHHQQGQHQQSQHHHHHHHHLVNGRRLAAVSMNCEFELSTDTDDESVNDGEADSSNSLTPWELAIEALRDSRPKERERLLAMLQRMLNDNQNYRLQNQQLKELIEVRNEQINKLQTELQHCQRQLGMLQISQQQQQQQHSPATMATNLNGGGSNGLITKALRKETSDDHQLMLRVPLKKSQRREPESYERDYSETNGEQRVDEGSRAEESFQHNLKQIKRELSESMEEDDEEEEREHDPESGREREESSHHRVESSQKDEREEDEEVARVRRNHDSCSESEQEENEENNDNDDQDHETDADGDTKMSSPNSQTKRSQSVESVKRHLSFAPKDSMDSEEDEDEEEETEEPPSLLPRVNQQHNPATQDEQHHNREEEEAEEEDDNDDEEEEEDDNDDDDAEEEDDEQNTHKRVQAPHSNAINTPPTATTPLSPDSAATAGQLFDSSNSSDESSMKKAQMSASNALAKMSSETNDGLEEQQEEEDDDEENDHQSLTPHHERLDADEEDSREEGSQQSVKTRKRGNSLSDQESSEGEEDDEHDQKHQQHNVEKAQQLHFRLEKTTSSTPTSNHIHSNNNTNTNATVVLATKASKKINSNNE